MSTRISVTPIDLTLSAIWMLQPEYTSFRQALEAKGYTLKDLRAGPIITLATKGSIEVISNVERRTIGIRSEKSTRDLQIAQEDLEQIYKELGVEESNLLIFEFVGSFISSATKSPLELMKAFTIEKDVLRQIGTILEEDIVTVGLKLTNKEGKPTSTDWLSVSIEPLYPTANKSYIIRVVFRGEKEKVITFLKRIEKRIEKIIKKLEETT